MTLTVARIERATGVVVNIELADQAWVDAQQADPEFEFVPYAPSEPAAIGYGYDPETGFEQPPQEGP